MSKPDTEWKVLPHGTLARLEENLMTVTGDIHMPLTDLQRRMTVARLADGRLVIFSAMALNEDEMSTLEAFGRPAYLVVPGDHHRLDAKAWKQRFPDIQVVAPEGAVQKVKDAVAVDTSSPSFGDPSVQFVTVAGTRGHEAALVVRSASGTTLVLNDIVGNIKHESGFSGWVLRMAGFAGDHAQIPKVVQMMIVEDRASLKNQLSAWAAIDSLKRILVSHGLAIEDDPRQVLLELAISLG